MKLTNMTNYLKLLLIIGAMTFAGGPFDHTVNAFQYFKKPLAQIDNWDRLYATIDHAKTDAIIAENGTNLLLTQGLCSIIGYEKAKSKGYGKQYKMAALYGNGFDILDKALTGGVIESQLEQIPVIGEYLTFLVPNFTNSEIIHALPGYPQPQYSMTEHQYYFFQWVELLLFCAEIDMVKVRGNAVLVEVSL